MSDLPTAKTRPASNWSAIWILPLIALMIGGWLAWQAYSKAGVEIEVRFESGEGIVANKTEVIYKGMPVGKVKSLVLDAEGDNQGVIATIEMNKDAEPHPLVDDRHGLETAVRVLANAAPRSGRGEVMRASVVQQQERADPARQVVIGEQAANGKAITYPMGVWAAVDTQNVFHEKAPLLAGITLSMIPIRR